MPWLVTFLKQTEQGYVEGPGFGCTSPARANSRSSGLLLFATTRSVFKSVKVSVVEIAKRTN